MILGRSPLARQPLACGATGGSTSLLIDPRLVLQVAAAARRLAAPAIERIAAAPAPARRLAAPAITRIAAAPAPARREKV